MDSEPVVCASGEPQKKSRLRRKAARPGELVRAALELFAEKGYSAARLIDVAERAGVAKGTVYRYFASKEALFRAVMDEAILPALQRSEQRIEDHVGPTSDLLGEVLRDWVRILNETPLGRIPKMVVSDADKFPDLASAFHQATIAGGRSVLRNVIARGIRSGEFRDSQIDATADVLLAGLLMPAIARFSTGFEMVAQRIPKAYADAMIDLTLKGLERKGGTHP